MSHDGNGTSAALCVIPISPEGLAVAGIRLQAKLLEGSEVKALFVRSRRQLTAVSTQCSDHKCASSQPSIQGTNDIRCSSGVPFEIHHSHHDSQSRTVPPIIYISVPALLRKSKERQTERHAETAGLSSYSRPGLYDRRLSPDRAGCRLCLFFSRMGILDGSFDWEE